MSTSQNPQVDIQRHVYVEASFKVGKELKTLLVQFKKFQTKAHAKVKKNKIVHATLPE